METEQTPQEEWKALKSELLARIRAIDAKTPWQEQEPKWWLEMMEVHNAAASAK